MFVVRLSVRDDDVCPVPRPNGNTSLSLPLVVTISSLKCKVMYVCIAELEYRIVRPVSNISPISTQTQLNNSQLWTTLNSEQLWIWSNKSVSEFSINERFLVLHIKDAWYYLIKLRQIFIDGSREWNEQRLFSYTWYHTTKSFHVTRHKQNYTKDQSSYLQQNGN